jgi:hypothetical protein
MTAQRKASVKKALHVSTAHHPTDHRIFRKEALGLVANGYKVALAITVDRPQVRNQVEFIPLGKYGGSRWRRIPRNLRALLVMLTSSADIVHIHDPELLVTVIPVLLAGKRVVYDIHEFYHQRLVDSDWVWVRVRSLAAGLYSVLERLLLPHFAGIVVVTEGMEEMYRRRFPRANISLVRNYPAVDEEARSLALSQKAPIDGPYIVHTGGAKRNKAFNVLVAVGEKLRERGVQAPIVNIGPVDLSAFPAKERDRLVERARDADIRLPGALEYVEVLRWVAHARVGYVLYPDTENFRLALSTKLYEYFALGLPVVATSVGRMGELVREHQAGLVVAPDDIDAHAHAFERLLTDDDFARRSAEASREASKHFSFDSELASLLNLYDRTLGTEAH